MRLGQRTSRFNPASRMLSSRVPSAGRQKFVTTSEQKGDQEDKGDKGEILGGELFPPCCTRSITVIVGSAFFLVTTSLPNGIVDGSAIAQHSENPNPSQEESSLVRALLGPSSLPPATPNSPNQRANPLTVQVTTFPDIQGHWAQSFIERLAARDVIRGFPDGTFRPDAPVTRVQFAAMIRKAFAKAPIRAGADFVDVPTTYWGYTAIQDAYRIGFLEGYPNRVFLPDQNIPRVQVLVSLANGLNLTPTASADSILNRFFQDAGNIPDYALNSVAAATENQIVVSYPNVAVLNPNLIATRADVAAFIYQALVETGQLPALPPTNIATGYIVGYQAPVAQQPDAETLRQRFRLAAPPVTERSRRVTGSGSGIGTPSAFGADRNTAFGGFSFQERTRNSDNSDGGIALGFGVGDASTSVGFEGTVSIYDLLGDTFEDGGISFKVHRIFPNNFAVALGVENFITWGNPDPEYSSAYGVVSKVFPLGGRTEGFTRSVTTSVGLGGGRFRSESDIENGDSSLNLFGSVGVRIAEPIALKAEWTGQDLNVGASIYPIPGTPLVITPAIADVTGNTGDGVRFILGIGYGYQF